MTGQLLHKFRNHGPLSRRTKFLILALVPVYFMAAGLFLQPLNEVLKGIITIIREPDFLITDYIAIGGIGAAFINAGVLALISIAIVYYLGMEMSGHTITSCFLMFGFSLFGKNILNIWSIMMGVCLYAFYHKTSSYAVHLCWFLWNQPVTDYHPAYDGGTSAAGRKAAVQYTCGDDHRVRTAAAFHTYSLLP